MSDSYSADFTLEVLASPLSCLWRDLFKKLPGYAVGIGLDHDLAILNRMLSVCYKFMFREGPVKIKTVDLQVLLALAGYNSLKTCLSVMNYTFVGGFIQKNWRIQCGLSLWSQLSLPLSLSLYLQSEAVAALNVVNVACLALLVHWFVVPGIAAVASHKTPMKFISWFSRLLISFLDGAQLPGHLVFSSGVDRVISPEELVTAIQYPEGSRPASEPLLRRFRSSLPEAHCLKKSSVTQLMFFISEFILC
jgi:hypothetical protein